MNKEIEVKFKIKDKEKLLEKLRILGGEKKESVFQRTYGFFTDNYSNIKEGMFPRVRVDDPGVINSSAVFTVKVKKEKKSRYFERDEYETEISNYKAVIDILKKFGFTNIHTFDKVREIWILPGSNLEILIDTLPFGIFIELEGEKENIEKTIERLELKGKRITRAYLGVYEDYCKENNLKIEKDILFKEINSET